MSYEEKINEALQNKSFTYTGRNEKNTVTPKASEQAVPHSATVPPLISWRKAEAARQLYVM